MFSRLGKALQEPLVQFITIGVVLFYLVETFLPNEGGVDNPYAIEVNEPVLIKFLQYQKKSFNAAAADAHWQGLTADAKEALVNDFVRDEVLYREALNLGLDEDDQIIRRRLIQKLDYVTRGFITDVAKVSEGELEQFFADNKDDYKIDASVTFTHVFFDVSKHGDESAMAFAQETLQQLNDNKAPFENAPNFGDRFLFHRNYVDRTPAFVQSHFGDKLAENVFALPASNQQWQGPFVSKYGVHLVMVTKNLPSRMPELEEVAGLVLEGARRLKLDAARRDALEKMISKYSIEGDLAPEEKAEQAQQAQQAKNNKSQVIEDSASKIGEAENVQ